MDCCKLSCCILMARLTSVCTVQDWPWRRLYYIYVVLEARAVQNKRGSDVGRLLPFCQISYSRWCSFCVAFLTALQWGMIPHLAQGLTIQSPQLSCLQRTGTSRMSSYRIITLQPTATPNFLWRQQCAQWGWNTFMSMSRSRIKDQCTSCGPSC